MRRRASTTASAAIRVLLQTRLVHHAKTERPAESTSFSKPFVDPRRTTFASVVAMLVLVALALRVAGSLDAFWIDEIMSWRFARGASSVLDLFTRVHSDNNHHLNTIWMYLIRERWRWQVYRIPAVVSGTASVALVAALARRDGRAASVVACVLAAFSFMLVQYSSEARGYAPAMMFSLACVELMRRYLATRQRKYSLAFGACAIFGVLSHLTFVYVFVGLLAWSIIAIAGDGTLTSRERFKHLVRLHVVPAAFLGVFYAIEVSRLRAAGGPVYPVWDVVADTFAWALGGPRSGAGLWLVVGAGVVTFVLELITMARRCEHEWVLYAVAVFVAPAAMLLLWKQPY